MKASYIEQHGGPDIQIYGDLPDPVAGPGEVIVDIHAATVNAADAKVRAGGTYGELDSFPYILGRDFSGVVSALGDGVTDFAVGDAVFGACDRGQEGTYAEKIAMKAAIIAKKPDGVSHIEAACLTLTGLTAIISVEETLKLQSDETILIQGGAGGVAGFAIELAKHLGGKVQPIGSDVADSSVQIRNKGNLELDGITLRDGDGFVSTPQPRSRHS